MNNTSENNTPDLQLNINDDICDLEPDKLCDSCGKCLEDAFQDYKVVRIDGLLNNDDDEIELTDYLLEDETLAVSPEVDADQDVDDVMNKIDYIEDIPQIKEEYDRKINQLLGRKYDE